MPDPHRGSGTSRVPIRPEPFIPEPTSRPHPRDRGCLSAPGVVLPTVTVPADRPATCPPTVTVTDVRTDRGFPVGGHVGTGESTVPEPTDRDRARVTLLPAYVPVCGHRSGGSGTGHVLPTVTVGGHVPTADPTDPTDPTDPDRTVGRTVTVGSDLTADPHRNSDGTGRYQEDDSNSTYLITNRTAHYQTAGGTQDQPAPTRQVEMTSSFSPGPMDLDELSRLAFDRESVQKAKPHHNEKTAGAVRIDSETIQVFFARCMGAESGFGTRIIVLNRRAQGYGADMQMVWKVTSETFLPAPRTLTSRKGSSTLSADGDPGFFGINVPRKGRKS